MSESQSIGTRFNIPERSKNNKDRRDERLDELYHLFSPKFIEKAHVDPIARTVLNVLTHYRSEYDVIESLFDLIEKQQERILELTFKSHGL
jgi:CRISPR/Cas system-associated protein Cas10 (large subunit of type III CRISPR-Cas system)